METDLRKNIVLYWPDKTNGVLGTEAVSKIVAKIDEANFGLLLEKLQNNLTKSLDQFNKKTNSRFVRIMESLFFNFENSESDTESDSEPDEIYNAADYTRLDIHMTSREMVQMVQEHFDDTGLHVNSLAHAMQKKNKAMLMAKIKVEWKKITGKWSSENDDKRLFFQALRRARELDKKEVIRILLGQIGVNPYLLEAVAHYPDLVGLILTAPKLDINRTNGDGETALHIACMQPHFKKKAANIVELLLQVAGLDVNKGKENGATPLYVACEKRNDHFVQQLLAHRDIDVNKGMNNGWTPLMVVCEYGKLSCVKLLLNDDNIDVNKANNYGDTPLIVACENMQEMVVEQLLATVEIDVNLRNHLGNTPLHALALLAQGGWELDDFMHIVQCVQRLLEVEEIEVDLYNHDLLTPLGLTFNMTDKKSPDFGLQEFQQSQLQLLFMDAGADTSHIHIPPDQDQAASSFPRTLGRFRAIHQWQDSELAAAARILSKKTLYHLAPQAFNLVCGMIGQYCHRCARLIHGRWFRNGDDILCINCHSRMRDALSDLATSEAHFVQWVLPNL